uniref:EamA domain-containing protein n=1 Tax=Chromera velia CCMP2878 TaxID=1169474 RepID=A0A0G4HXX2_9ALVE|eukprot:Cvel_9369.t1-p1 / transcript=Cvel_9369.t1 / gene=Cvel_9369 / organism=Chromera_velia_CCMP2878 / gene_product=hypothetical protein / transcript_product=hypothetical protein / location=Cvel_scaffold538:16238-18281(+) / protein_length=428 / sequence_SO=supercontig / SO=protein_coding / is_pseudo=false
MRSGCVLLAFGVLLVLVDGVPQFPPETRLTDKVAEAQKKTGRDAEGTELTAGTGGEARTVSDHSAEEEENGVDLQTRPEDQTGGDEVQASYVDAIEDPIKQKEQEARPTGEAELTGLDSTDGPASPLLTSKSSPATKEQAGGEESSREGVGSGMMERVEKVRIVSKFFLWMTGVSLGVCSLWSLLSSSGRQAAREFGWGVSALIALACALGATAYVSMGVGIGVIEVGGRVVLIGRDWAALVTSPLMVFALGSSIGADRSSVGLTGVMGLFMAGCNLEAALHEGWMRWGLLLVGSLLLSGVIQGLVSAFGRDEMRQMAAGGVGGSEEERARELSVWGERKYRAAAAALICAWSLAPFVCVASRLGLLGVTTGVVCMSLVDLCAFGVSTVMLVSGKPEGVGEMSASLVEGEGETEREKVGKGVWVQAHV